MEENDPTKRAWVRSLGLFGVLVSDLVGYTGAGVGLGYLLWKKLELPWWVIIVTSVAGFGLAMHRLYKLAQREWL